jgi:hypothetical protein
VGWKLEIGNCAPKVERTATFVETPQRYQSKVQRTATFAAQLNIHHHPPTSSKKSKTYSSLYSISFFRNISKYSSLNGLF